MDNISPAKMERYKKLLKEQKIRKARTNIVDYAEARNLMIQTKAGTLTPIINNEYDYVREMLIETDKFLKDPDKKILVLNAPPRHGKSLSINKFIIPYQIGKNKQSRVAVISYSEPLATTASTVVKETLTEPKTSLSDSYISHADIFGESKVMATENSKTLWRLEGAKQRTFTAASIFGGNITGSGFDLIVIDDTIKNSEDAMNVNHTDKVNAIVKDTFFSRDGKIIVVQTRWGENDLTDFIEKEFPNYATFVSYKAYNEETGEMLNPNLLSKETYDMLEDILHETIFYANYQQETYIAEGYMYGDEINFYQDIPDYAYIKNFAALDIASGTGKDYTALVCATHDSVDNKLYLQDIYHRNDEQDDQMLNIAKKLKENETEVVFVEKNYGGDFLVNKLKESLIEVNYFGIEIIDYTTTKNKFDRIEMFSPLVKTSYVWPEHMNKEMEESLEVYKGFKAAEKANRNDDLPDAMTTLVERVIIKEPVFKQSKAYELLMNNWGLEDELDD